MDYPTNNTTLDQPPPSPPRSSRGSVMDLALDHDQGLGIESMDPMIKIQMSVGQSRKALMQLAADLPQLAPGIQQFLSGLGQVVPQLLAELSTGQPSAGGGAMVNQAPTAPPVTTSAV